MVNPVPKKIGGKDAAWLLFLGALAVLPLVPGVADNSFRMHVFILVLLYALADEFHQSFVPGRHPSLVDALVIDAAGAALALFLAWRVRKKKK